MKPPLLKKYKASSSKCQCCNIFHNCKFCLCQKAKMRNRFRCVFLFFLTAIWCCMLFTTLVANGQSTAYLEH